MSNGHYTRGARDDSDAPAPAAASTGGPDYLTIAQAAAILNCSKKTVQRLITTGRVHAIDVGAGRQRSYRVRRVDLELGLAVPPPAPAPRRGRRRLADIRYIREVI